MNEQKQEVGGVCLARGFVLCIAQLLLHIVIIIIIIIIIIIVEDRVKVMLLLLHITKKNRGVGV